MSTQQILKSAVALAVLSTANYAAASTTSAAQTCNQAALAQYLTQQNSAYHAGQPCISDAQFDHLNQLLAEPIATLDSHPTGNLVRHRFAMISLNSTTNPDTLAKFIQPLRQQHSPLVIQPKIDGIAVELVYQQGALVQASTRGNGQQGQNITALIHANPTIVQQLSQTIDAVIYGELFMPKSAFNQLTGYTSARQVTAALAKQQQPNRPLAQQLRFFPYQLAQPLLEGDHASQAYLQTLGFTNIDSLSQPLLSQADAEHWLQQWQAQSPLDADIDGVVIKVAQQHIRRRLGQTQTHPHWAIAYKPQPTQQQVTVNNISYRVGRTGKITPILHFSTIELGAKKVSKVSGHSLNYLTSRPLYIGSKITVALAGAATPSIVQIAKPKVESNIPTHLPAPPYVKAGLCLAKNYACQQRFILQLRYTMRKLKFPLATRKQIVALAKQGAITQIGQLAPFYQRTFDRALSPALLLESLNGRTVDLAKLPDAERTALQRQLLLMARSGT